MILSNFFFNFVKFMLYVKPTPSIRTIITRAWTLDIAVANSNVT